MDGLTQEEKIGSDEAGDERSPYCLLNMTTLPHSTPSQSGQLDEDFQAPDSPPFATYDSFMKVFENTQKSSGLDVETFAVQMKKQRHHDDKDIETATNRPVRETRQPKRYIEESSGVALGPENDVSQRKTKILKRAASGILKQKDARGACLECVRKKVRCEAMGNSSIEQCGSCKKAGIEKCQFRGAAKTKMNDEE